MRELWILTARHIRTTLRSRTTPVLGLLYLMALLAAIWLPGEARAEGGTVALLALGALLVVLASVVASSGALLPGDRLRGREAWIRSTAPPAWKHRVAPALAGAVLGVGAGVLGGFCTGIMLLMVAPQYAPRTPTPLAMEGVDGRAPLIRRAQSPEEVGPTFVVPLAAEPETPPEWVELEIAPRIVVLLRRDADTGERRATQYAADLLVDTVEASYAIDGGAWVTETIPVRSPWRIAVPANAREVQVRNHSHLRHLAVLRARSLGHAHGVIPTFLWAGLLLGIAAAAVAPVAVLFSRVVSASSATAAGFVVFLFGSLRAPLLEIAASLSLEGPTQLARGLIEAVGTLVPDLPSVYVLSELAAERAVDLGSSAALVAPLTYFGLGLLLLVVPMPASWREYVAA